MNKIDTLLQKPMNRLSYVLSYAVVVLFGVLVSQLLVMAHAPSLLVANNLSYWNYPYLTLVVITLSTVLIYKRLIDFCRKNTAMLVLFLVLLNIQFDFYLVYYSSGFNSPIGRVDSLIKLILLLVLISKKGKSKK